MFNSLHSVSRLVFLILLCNVGFAAANGPIHSEVQKSLVHLSGSSTAETGELQGIKDGLKSQATGFFVGGDGFVLTSKHFFKPLRKNKGFNLVLTAKIGDAGVGNPVLPVKFVSELPWLDLMLLKVEFPFGAEIPTPLKLGSSNRIDRANPQPLFTSGFHGIEYRQLSALFNKESSTNAPYVWSINVKTNPGQSGSPVYFADGTVVGLIKGVEKSDDELTYVVPIEYSMPLIGHFRIEKLEAQIEMLIRAVGQIESEDSLPMGDRLNDVEEDLKEIEKQFFWTAESMKSDGSLVVRYEKLVSGGPQVDQLGILLEPNMRVSGDVTKPMSSLPLSEDNTFQRSNLTPDSRFGEFIIPQVQAKLETLLSLTGDAVGKPEPYRDIDLTIIPSIDGEDLSPRKIKLVPKYDWK